MFWNLQFTTAKERKGGMWSANTFLLNEPYIIRGIRFVQNNQIFKIKRIVGLQATHVQGTKRWKAQFRLPKKLKRKSNVERLVEISIGYRNSTPHKATPKIGRALLVDQACTPKEGTLHRLHFFNWKSSTTRSWYRNRPFQPKSSISVQLESKSILNKWCLLSNPLDFWPFSHSFILLLDSQSSEIAKITI